MTFFDPAAGFSGPNGAFFAQKSEIKKKSPQYRFFLLKNAEKGFTIKKEKNADCLSGPAGGGMG